MSAQIAADLRAAAEVLRRDGWTQGDLVDKDGCRCVLGAIDRAAWERLDERSVDDDLVQEMWTAVAKIIGTNAIVKWNDDPGRTADEVIAALEAAAAAAEADQ